MKGKYSGARLVMIQDGKDVISKKFQQVTGLNDAQMKNCVEYLKSNFPEATLQANKPDKMNQEGGVMPKSV